MLGAPPAKVKPDYAQWMLDDPRVNFAISTRAATTGVDHLGIQVDEDEELAEMRNGLTAARLAVFDAGETVCCYARSDKSWVKDPNGIPWEAYRTLQDADIFSSKPAAEESSCCAGQTAGHGACCESAEKAAGCCGCCQTLGKEFWSPYGELLPFHYLG